MAELGVAARNAGGDGAAVEASLLPLARRAAAGDSVATAQLLRALAPRLVAVVRAVLGRDHPDVDDASQQALIGFVQALPAFRGDCDPFGYARVIAVRAAIFARRRARERGARSAGPEAEALVGEQPSPREVADARRRRELVRDLLAELPPEQAETLALRVVLGCSLEETAEQTRVPLNTVRSRVRLAKERLRSRIEGDAALCEMLGVEGVETVGE